MSAQESPLSGEVAIRNPKRGKAHKRFSRWETTVCRSDSVSGARLYKSLTERIPVEQTDPDDRCARCFPPGAPQ